jgi:predicted transposase/invertase (TIGR01784 family)
MPRISPRVDIAFKKIFGVEENKDLLISLINSIVGEEDQVSEITLLNPYNPKNFKNDKLSILDVKAKGTDGKRFNIEIQISDEADYDKRALYYWAKLYTEQLEVAEDYSTLSKAIGIHILNFISIPSDDKYHNVFHITEKESGQPYFKDLELHTIELKKFTKNSNENLADIVAKVKNSLDMWIAFLTRNDLLKPDNLPKQLENNDLKKALNVLDVMNFSSEERDAYEGHLKWLRVEANTIKKIEDKARAEGEKKTAEAVERTRKEGREKIEKLEKTMEKIVNNLFSQGINIETIKQITGLSIEQIEELRNDL